MICCWVNICNYDIIRKLNEIMMTFIILFVLSIFFCVLSYNKLCNLSLLFQRALDEYLIMLYQIIYVHNQVSVNTKHIYTYIYRNNVFDYVNL